ncbi:hypothetical protein DFQ29_010262 [Apophysomyces sp. BC1021]|nr:hypothetical protein DFQ29_010262 [Apophysomyces sp. BC1021]
MSTTSTSTSVSAIEAFTNRMMVPVRDFAETPEVTLYQPRESYKQWIRSEENRLCCKFYDRSPSRGRQGSSSTASSSGESSMPVTTSLNKGGRPKKNLFYEVYMCHRSGSPRPSGDNSAPKRRRKAAPLLCNCTAAIYVPCELADPSRVKVRYSWKHIGHQPRSISDLNSAPISSEIREWIQQKVEENFTWIQFKHMLRVDKEILQNILDESAALPLTLRIGYQEVYYAIRSSLQKKAHLAPALEESLHRWGTKIVQQQGFFKYERMDQYADGTFIFAFHSSWQLQTQRIILATMGLQGGVFSTLLLPFAEIQEKELRFLGSSPTATPNTIYSITDAVIACEQELQELRELTMNANDYDTSVPPK